MWDEVRFKDATTSRVRSWHAGLHKQHPSTAQGAYRLLRQVLNAAVDDGRLAANPCRVKGAGVDEAAERPTASVPELTAIADAMPEHLRLAVLLAGWCGLRSSELLGLRRCDLDPAHRTVTIARTRHELDDGSMVIAGPKTKASGRTISYPPNIADDVEEQLARFVDAGREAAVFVGERSGEPLRPRTLGSAFRQARLAAGRDDLTLHDLRHTANTLAAIAGASLAELMYRQGHSTVHSAQRYLHATADRDRAIAEAMAGLQPVAPVVDLNARKS
jgi:integrase